MTHPTGTYRLGPRSATLLVRTRTAGPAAKAGHNDLDLLGRRGSTSFALALAPDGSFTAGATVVQSRFGIRPYSAMLRALKVADEVEVSVTGPLGPALSTNQTPQTTE